MVYKQIALGPFYGLFAIHFDEYATKWSQQEVVERIDQAEKLLNLTGGKKLFVFNGFSPLSGTPDEISCLALCDMLHARGYTIQTMSDGNYYPLHAGKSDSVVAVIKGDKWINYPCNAVVWYPETIDDPPILFRPSTMNVPKYLYLTADLTKDLIKFLHDSEYCWAVQRVDGSGRVLAVTL